MSIVSLVLAPVFKDCCVSDFHTESGWATGIAALVLMIVLSATILYYIGSVNAAWYEQIEQMASNVKGKKVVDDDESKTEVSEIELGDMKGDTK